MKKKVGFICASCEFTVGKWEGRCPSCGLWNSFLEIDEYLNQKTETSDKNKLPLALHQVGVEKLSRISSGLNEFDRVLGGGFVSGSVILLGGEPGVGKSSLILQVCGKIEKLSQGLKVFYASGEESPGQIADRAQRLGINSKNTTVYNQHDWAKIKAALLKDKPTLFILDSIQTTVSDSTLYNPGTPSQLKEIASEIVVLAKSENIICIIIGHITKDGSLSGPKFLEHMVDTVLYFKGCKDSNKRILSVKKNRFGDTKEVGLLKMTLNGLEEVTNPSSSFLDSIPARGNGRIHTFLNEGSRPLLVEIQSLVLENAQGNGKRSCYGIENSRLLLLLAVCEKTLGKSLNFKDIYVNIVGGLNLKSRDSDLGVLASVLSSMKELFLPTGVLFIGEVGLSGEIRGAQNIEGCLPELQKMDYKWIVLPKNGELRYQKKFPQIKFLGAETIEELISLLMSFKNKAA